MPAMMWFIWLVSLVICAAPVYGIYRYARRFPPLPGGPTAGVAGWLLLLVAGLLFLGPTLGTLRLIGEFGYVEYKNHALRTSSAWSNYKSISLGIYCIFACVSFYGGLGLAALRNALAVRRAILVLWLAGPMASVVLALIQSLVAFGAVQFTEAQNTSVIGSVIYAAIWTWYLRVSKRVHATYGGHAAISVPHAELRKFTLPSSRRLGGWQRIGILLSIAWLVVVILYTAYEMRLGPASRMLLIEMIPGSTSDSSGIIWDVGPQVDIGRFVLACFGPILLGWLLPYFGSWAVRWVKAGFETNAP